MSKRKDRQPSVDEEVEDILAAARLRARSGNGCPPWWLSSRLLVLATGVGFAFVALATQWMWGMVILAGCTTVAAVLDAVALRIRFHREPLHKGAYRGLQTIDMWQPVAAFAVLSQVGHGGNGLDYSATYDLLLGGLGLAPILIIFLSRRLYV